MNKLAILASMIVAVLSLPAYAKEPPVSPSKQALSQQQNKLELININTASATELILLIGIGESKANAIVEYRETHGEFKTLEELAKVKGIGAKLVEKNRAMMRL